MRARFTSDEFRHDPIFSCLKGGRPFVLGIVDTVTGKLKNPAGVVTARPCSILDRGSEAIPALFSFPFQASDFDLSGDYVLDFVVNYAGGRTEHPIEPLTIYVRPENAKGRR